MLYTILAAADRFREVSVGEAALYALLGFAIVFLGIAFLILVVWLVGKIMTKTSGGAKPTKPKAKMEPKQEKTVTAPAETDEISEETLAVITAALMAYYQQTGKKCEFTVKRIKRI